MVNIKSEKDSSANELTLRQQISQLESRLKQLEAERDQLLTAEREQRALADALCQTGAVLTGNFNNSQVLDSILEQISRVVPHDAASILMAKGNIAYIVRRRSCCKTTCIRTSTIFDIDRIAVLNQVQKSQQPIAVGNAGPADAWIAKFGRDWVKSYAIAPIISKGRFIGFLSVESETPNFFDQTEAKYLKAFADQSALALENAWLYEQARHEIVKHLRALKKERNFVSAVLNTVSALVVVFDSKGRIVRYNRACQQTIGYTLAEVKGRYIWDLFLTPQDVAPVKANFQQLQAGQFPINHTNYWRTRSGSRRLIAWTDTVLLNNNGKVEYIISTGLDITEQQQTEKALKENEKNYRSLTNQLPIGVYRITPAGKLLQANPALAHILGYEQVDHMLQALPGSICHNPFNLHKLLPRNGTDIIENEFQCRTKTGKQIWVRNTGRVIYNGNGQIDYIGGTLEDITQRKLAEEAQRQSEERFKHLISSISDHIYVTETTDNGIPKTIYLSPHVEALTGYPWEKFKDDWRFWLSVVIHPDDRVIAGTQMARAFMGSQSEVEYRLIRADGEIVWVRDSVRVESRSNSKIIYGVVSDITERKRAEEALAAEQKRLAVTLRSINDGVIAVDAQGRIVLANPVARTYLAELTSADFGDILTHLGNCPLADILSRPSESENYREIILEGPPRQIFEVAAQPMDAGRQTNGWVLIIRDVTDKRAFQERVQQQERLAAVGQLAAGIAHDFNNILTCIIGLAELTADAPDVSAKISRDMGRIAEQGRRAAHLTRQILDFGRQSITEKRPLKLDTFLKEIVKLLKRTISEEVQIKLHINPDEYILNADPTQIQQVITNLALNAKDAMPGGGTLRFKLSRLVVRADQATPYPDMSPGEWLSLTVSDTGEGIAPENLSHIFEPFFTTKTLGRGTGLGLAQVYGIIKQHEGHIDVESQLNQGTTFTLYLPALPASKNSLPQKATQAKIPLGHGEVILLVEDNATVLSVTQSMLSQLGYKVLAATNGRHALDMYERYKDEINLILTDITMPEMGGVDLCKALRAKDKSVKVVAMTGYPLKMAAEDLLAQGIVGWLAKPLSIEKVAQGMSQALSASSALQFIN